MTTLREAAAAALEALYCGEAPPNAKQQTAAEVLRAALAEQCQCGDRPAAECPGEWEPGCDLGANEAHAKVFGADPQNVGQTQTESKQEPVAWAVNGGFFYFNKEDAVKRSEKEGGAKFWPLYTHPAPQRQPLTDEEIDRVTDVQWAANHNRPVYAAHRAFARAIEQRHGIGGQDDAR